MSNDKQFRNNINTQNYKISLVIITKDNYYTKLIQANKREFSLLLKEVITI